jgi:hypothetical protein
MNIIYTFNIRQLSRTKVYGIPDIVSHIHYDYVGTDESGNSSFCQGVVPFELKPIETTNPSTGEVTVTPSVFDQNNYIPYDQITNEIILEWLNDSVPEELIQIFKNIISQKLTEQE